MMMMMMIITMIITLKPAFMCNLYPSMNRLKPCACVCACVSHYIH